MKFVYDLPGELRERVMRLNAELRCELLRTDAAVWLACDLLVAGVETPALVELAGESPTRLIEADATPLVRQTLAELEVEPIDISQAAWIIARDIARQMIDGDLLPEAGAHSLCGLYWSCDTAEEIGVMILPLDAWEDTRRPGWDGEALRAEMRELARGLLDHANARLAAGSSEIPAKKMPG